MRLAWLSASAALCLTACGAAAAHSLVVDGTVSSLGLQITMVSSRVHDNPLPYLEGPPGTHCVYYTLQVRSLDGQRHDLRPSQFSAGGAMPADAVARCGYPQVEPTWVDSRTRTVVVAILESQSTPAPLSWQPEE